MKINTNSDKDYLLNVAEAAHLLKLSPGTVYHLISQKRIPFVKISARCVRFSRTAILLWLDSLTQAATPFEHLSPLHSPTGHLRRTDNTQPKTARERSAP